MPKRFFLFFLLFLPVGIHAQNIDIRILRSINSAEIKPSDNFFRFVSNSEIYFVIGVPVVMATAGIINDDKELFRDAVAALAASAISSGITNALKYSVNRDRPFVTYPDITKKSAGGSPSFPSGHTSSAFTTATCLSLAYPKWYIIVPLYIWAGSVGFSRMYLGVHYPSDVFAGALTGAGSAYLTHVINKKLNEKKRARRTITKTYNANYF